MINISSWKTFLILAAVVLSILYCLPNVIGADGRAWTASHLPSFFPTKSVNLGLDLRGGAHLLYEVDVDGVLKERSDLMTQDLRTQLREAKVAYLGIGGLPQGVTVTLKDANDASAATLIVRKLDPNIDVMTTNNGLTVQGVLNQKAMNQIFDQTISQSIEIVRRRIDALGTTEPLIARQGTNRILIQAPGAHDDYRFQLNGVDRSVDFVFVRHGAD